MTDSARWLVVALALAVGCTDKADDDDPLDTDESATSTPTEYEGLDGWRWPVAGEDGVDWVINNYVDLDQGSTGMLDYAGGVDDGAKTYDDHRGVDIDVSTFREMDSGTPILAVAAGVVTDTRDGEFDRNTSCASMDWNYVAIDNDDGYTLWYGHMRNGSVAVEVGDIVDVGDTLGEIGSSGCSTHPHLHLEVHLDGELVDPFEDGLWAKPPVYETPLSIMTGLLREGGFSGITDIQDPGPQASSISSGTELGFGVSVAGGGDGDEFEIEVFSPDGSTWDRLSMTFDQTWRHSFWYWNRSPDEAGTWTAQFKVGKDVAESHDFEVTP